ncbi:16S rRNA (cytosine(1402)-N(4))-methyltransferase RsmH [Demequina sp. TTPB684]|uniref:16S rRNA (cytosine(1402)-N(4))-methyltransferase RsmH n=1 Tax=unclassified Demequina TaxID=2620311 RepID=UPI001CF3C723|nr:MULTISPECIES: 16S rRNA (cytosine(1402)-N(4))-methyltransferase RsmH [unclassified Demequina]MCB2411338.1 16S rRNA (cytosine(1402)-N(4))-methyltransferase RsmH [Demequina sp. TTPB684]UPU89573.1 16S rRNA (cytosine(1402)-N(4))-methyltransferase RsmH [Demequina sp. TMPB413]
MGTASFRHTPVLLDRCVELLSPALEQPGAVAIDATLGMGGHTEALLATNPQARVVGIDRDAQAIGLASERLSAAGDRFFAHHATYDDIAGALALTGATRADAILFDLGVSSLQIDEADRGFSYAQDAPLDMRMNREDPVTAASLLATASEDELTRILHVYGEERFARKIARSIVRRRESDPIERSEQLVDLVRACIPAATRTPGSNPAKRTFQALRIAVNSELDVLESALTAAIDAVRVGGRIVVLSYHSLEDRIVKHAFAAGTEITAPPGMPVVPDEAQPYLRLLTRGAEKATESEIDVNSRAKPVRLRAVERTRATPRRAA